jgi:hypothetical protein
MNLNTDSPDMDMNWIFDRYSDMGRISDGYKYEYEYFLDIKQYHMYY